MKTLLLFSLLFVCAAQIGVFAQEKGHIGGKSRPYEEPPEPEEKRDTVILIPGLATYEDIMAVFSPLKTAPPNEDFEALKKREKELSRLKDGAGLLVKSMENPLKKHLRKVMAQQNDLSTTDRLLRDAQAKEKAWKEQQGRIAELEQKGDKQSRKEIERIERDDYIDSTEVAEKIALMKDSVSKTKAKVEEADAYYKKMQQELKKPKELAYEIRATWAKVYNQVDSIGNKRGTEAKNKLRQLNYDQLFAADDTLHQNPNTALLGELKENLFYNKQGYDVDCLGSVGAGVLRNLPQAEAKAAGLDLTLGCKGFVKSLNDKFNMLFLRMQNGKVFAILWDQNADSGREKSKVGALKIY